MTPPVIVAIPARNEAGHIVSCLNAIAAQPGVSRGLAAVAVFANNCTDDTALAAQSVAMPCSLHVVAATLPPGQAHIGHARRGATDAAFACMAGLGLDDAIIAGTDADSRVAPGWLGALRAAFTDDIDAVCGAIDLDGELAPALSARLGAEAAYAGAVARVVHRLDPLPHDPWPNHIWCWGANFAVRAGTMAAAGGPPLVGLAEDRALREVLVRRDARIRHALDVRVTTSSRDIGRAPGGLADLMRQYAEDPQAEADFILEPARITLARAQLRGEERRRWGSARGFGAHQAALEAAHPAFGLQRVRLAELPGETAKLEHWLSVAERQSGRAANASG